MSNIQLTEQSLESISNILSEMTHREIEKYLGQSDIECITTGSNKKEKLFYSFIKENKKYNSSNKIMSLIQKVLDPVNYVLVENRESYNYMLEEINKVLIFNGLEINKSGDIVKVNKVDTLDEIDRKINSLRKKLYDRAIHDEVKKYCIKDYMNKDYYSTVFEAVKGLAQRVQNITGLKLDGSKLFQTSFSTSNPHIVLNNLVTDSEKSEFNGIRELLESIYHLVRNPAAHTPKIDWKTNETEVLDILTVISFAHKYLDRCYEIPRANKFT